jgi:hypothetical protein
METASTSETSVNYQTIRRYIPEDSHFRRYGCFYFTSWLYFRDLTAEEEKSEVPQRFDHPPVGMYCGLNSEKYSMSEMKAADEETE